MMLSHKLTFKHHSGCDSKFIEFRKQNKKLICQTFNSNMYGQCLCKRVYLVFFVSSGQSSELLTTHLNFVLNQIFLISFVLFELQERMIQGDFLQKRAVSEGVFKNCSLKQHFFAKVSLNQLQGSSTFSDFSPFSFIVTIQIKG